MTDALAQARKALEARITEYLSLGGLFNPEAMEHDKVRDLLIDCRSAIAAIDAAQGGASAPAVEGVELELVTRLLKTRDCIGQKCGPERTQAASAISRLVKERDALVLSTGEHITRRSELLARAEAAEASVARLTALLAEADEVVKPFAKAADNAERLAGHDGPLGQYVELEHLRPARRYQQKREAK